MSVLWRRSIVFTLRSNFPLAHQICRQAPSTLVTRQFSGLQQLNPSIRPLLRRPLSQPTLDVQTNARRYLHPFVVLVAQQLVKGVAVLTGRGFRKWWKSLPPNKRAYFAQRAHENRGKIAIGFGVTGGLVTVYYVSHLQRAPITGRLRFIVFNDEQMKKITEFQHEMEVEALQKVLFPSNHLFVRRVKMVAERLLAGNRDLEQIYNKEWSVSVVNTPQQNAFVLPNGQIYVFRGMLELCETDDELGCILAHEMAHAILSHSAENISYAHLIDMCVIVLLAAIWAVMPSDGLAAITHWFFNKVVDLMLNLPYSRKIETEADTVGLELAAKACFDVRHSSTFWAKMALLREFKDQDEVPEFLSTHPADATRSEQLNAQMAEALKKRVECRCPPLSRPDPRLMIEGLRHQISAAKQLQHQAAKDGVACIIVK